MKMNIKFVFVIGILLVSAFAEEKIVEPEKLSQSEKVSKLKKVSEAEKEASAEAKAEVNLGDVKIEDKNVNKEVLEDIEKTDNGLKASASASASFSFNFEEFLAKWFEACQQNKESIENEEEEMKKEENNQDAEDNAQSKENPSEEEMKSPCIYSYNVHARSSASAISSPSASASSSFYFYDPKEDKKNIEDENAEESQKDDDDVDGLQKNIPEQEQKSDVENVQIQEHCNKQNSEDKKPLVDEPLVDIQSAEEPLKTEETQVEEVEQQ